MSRILSFQYAICDLYIFFFKLSLLNPGHILHLHHISVRTDAILGAR